MQSTVVMDWSRFQIFEWFVSGASLKSPSYGAANVRCTDGRSIDFQDKLGVVAAMGDQLTKSVAMVILSEGKSQQDYEYVRNHLAKIMMDGAKKDKRREPEGIAIYHLAWLIARIVIDYALDPELESGHKDPGRLVYAGIRSFQMNPDVYRQTWKRYEKLMVTALEEEIKKATKIARRYKEETLNEVRN
ncbi:hypothetical protein CAT65_14545 [Acinetobacter pittii]|uniref:hypothetical protein n=1 Tax=Acinetobacter pittii TaxID=48296 RepID=UPI000A38045B|nr:hypothetical protein [Acinetobacter pittii]OTU09729.1 hypothetical protein CAT65_14545 [Acinetobacter pittii]